MAAARVAAAYPLLLGLGALDATGYSVIVPVGPAIADATGAGPATIGLLVASFPAGMVAGFAVAGWVVRRFGPRWLLIASLGLVAVGALCFVVSNSLGVYFAARTIMGIGSGGIWIGVTFDTLGRWPGQEYMCMSRVFAAYSAGGLIGPALGTFGGIHGPFLAYLALVLLAIPLVLLVTPAARRDFTGDRAMLRTAGFVLAAAAIFFASLALGVLEGVLPLHFADRLAQAQIGALYVGASVVVAAGATASGGRRPATAMPMMSTGRPLPGVPGASGSPSSSPGGRYWSGGAGTPEPWAGASHRPAARPTYPATVRLSKGGIPFRLKGGRTLMGPAAHIPDGPKTRLTPASPNVETDKRASGSGVGEQPGGPELMASKAPTCQSRSRASRHEPLQQRGRESGAQCAPDSSHHRPPRPGAKGLHGPLGGLDGLGVVAEERLGRLAPTVPNLYGVAGFVKTVARIRRPVLAF